MPKRLRKSGMGRPPPPKSKEDYVWVYAAAAVLLALLIFALFFMPHVKCPTGLNSACP